MPQYTTYELGEMIANAASGASINPRVAVEQLRRESVNFSPYYVYGPGKSPAGAEGLAQFIPGTWRRFGSGSPYNPPDAIRAYVRYMSFLLDMFNERYDIALAAYNSGENRNEYKAAAHDGRSINWSVMPAGVQRETKPYVEDILRRAGYRADAAVPSPEPVYDTGGDSVIDFGAADLSPFSTVYADADDEPEEDGSALALLFVALIAAFVL